MFETTAEDLDRKRNARFATPLFVLLWVFCFLAISLATFYSMSVSAQTETLTLVDANFNTDTDGFTYEDDLFRNTNQSTYASGSRTTANGYNNSGGLRVFLGGLDSFIVPDISGGWQIDFSLSSSKPVTITFRYALIIAGDYESDEFGQLLLSVDDVLYGQTPNDYIVQLTGDGNGGNDDSTGWQLFQVELDPLSAGTHTVKIGGYNNQKTQFSETTTVLIDDVLIIAEGEQPVPTPTIMPTSTPTTNPNGNVIFYSGNNYNGQSWALGEGVYDLPEIVASPVGNDAISSIQIPVGYEVTVCVDGSGLGDCETYVGSMPQLGSMNNEISYIEITFNPVPTATSTLTPTATSTLTPTATSTLTPTVLLPTNTPLPTATTILTPTNTPIPIATLVPSATPIQTSTPITTNTPIVPESTPTLLPTLSPTLSPPITLTVTPINTATASPTISITPDETPTIIPSPTLAATQVTMTPILPLPPTVAITLSPTVRPTLFPTVTGTVTGSPTALGTATPPSVGSSTPVPTSTPSPTLLPTTLPTITPTPSPLPIVPVLINEIDTRTQDEEETEFIELYDGGRGLTDLAGKTVVLFDGATDEVYAVIELDGYTTGPNGYFVIGRSNLEPAPTILILEPISQNGAIALYEEMTGLLEIGSSITTENLVDAIVYGSAETPDNELLALLLPDQRQVDENQTGNEAFESLQRCPNGFGPPRSTTAYTTGDATPMDTNDCGFDEPDEFAACGEIARPIHTIQGQGLVSPNAGFRNVVIEGIVIGDFQNADTQLGGFFLQEETFHADTDPRTSEGIFVYTKGVGINVNIGDIVRVQGNVEEFFEQTQISDVGQIEICGKSGNVTPIEITLPVDKLLDWEQYEGMSVKFPQALYITDNTNQGRFGELDLSAFRRLSNPTNLALPGPDAIALSEENARYRIVLDDGSMAQNPESLPYRGRESIARVGDAISKIEGVVSDSLGSYRIQPLSPAKISFLNKRPATVPDVGGTLKVASFNVFNYFNGNGAGAGFPTVYGADSPYEFERQSAKIVTAIAAIDADIVGIVEIENDSDPNSALSELVARLNQKVGAGTYTYIDTEVIGNNESRVAIIYQPASVEPSGAYQLLDSEVDETFNDAYNRPSLAQAFRHLLTGDTLTIVVNHLESKDADCSEINDIDNGDGQGNCSLTRTNAAKAIVNWLNQNPTQASDQKILVLGDLNAYAKEDPVTAFTQAGYTNLLQSFLGVNAYTYVFDGQTGYLDHALASTRLLPNITGITEWHINADEPRALDYNDSNATDLYLPDPFRSSDHDPIIVGIELADVDGQQQEFGSLFLPFLAR